MQTTFIPDNTSGQHAFNERENGPFRQDQFQQMHLRGVVKCPFPFKTYDDLHMRELITVLNSEAEIPTRRAMERDIERCMECGEEEMKQALAAHQGKFAFTVSVKLEYVGWVDRVAITAHWCTPDFRIVSALLGFLPGFDNDDVKFDSYADVFQHVLENHGIWPRVSHVTWVDTNVDEINDLAKDLAERIPGLSLERDFSLCLMGKINAAMKRPQAFDFWEHLQEEAVFIDTLVTKYKEQGARLFYQEDEVSTSLVFPRLEELIEEVERLQADRSMTKEQLEWLGRAFRTLMKRHESLRKSPAYYITLVLNPRIKDQHTQKWPGEWRNECEAQLQKIWESYKDMEEPWPMPRALPEPPPPKRQHPDSAVDGEEAAFMKEGEEEPDDLWLNGAEYVGKQENLAAKEWKEKLYRSMKEGKCTAADEVADVEDELERYRNEPIVALEEWDKTFSCKEHDWWAAVGQFRFPRVAAMARDFFAIQATVYPAYEAFNRAAIYDSKEEEMAEMPDNWSCPKISKAARSASMLATWWHKDVLGIDAVMHVPMGMRESLEDMLNFNESPFPAVGRA
ncbi:hypothetical protein FN846DRAFT_978220 [Sphaerosporella brunnea]|uniref:HAT C-terminal dimerisation domain-containing protein n=1 Tax=Sphaerosporella brunnea TaxID=1250544 RepID=A0A5J5EDD5_9PEZI|nr:hypothetical protein FN846DRAFT_978220 [Sphaerosporella brunnea]